VRGSQVLGLAVPLFLGLRVTHTPGAKNPGGRQELQSNSPSPQPVAGEARMLGNRERKESPAA
jgi:hypothetical protein